LLTARGIAVMIERRLLATYLDGAAMPLAFSQPIGIERWRVKTRLLYRACGGRWPASGLGALSGPDRRRPPDFTPSPPPILPRAREFQLLRFNETSAFATGTKEPGRVC
jgi:hypothetical protein